MIRELSGAFKVTVRGTRTKHSVTLPSAFKAGRNVQTGEPDSIAVTPQRAERAATTPVCVFQAKVKGVDVWLYQGKVYEADAGMKPADVRSLVVEMRDRRSRRVRRAQAVEAMVVEPGVRREAIPQDVQIAVWQRDGGTCVKCGSNERLEFDHIIPLSMGGANTLRNLQLLCEPCNREKGASIG